MKTIYHPFTLVSFLALTLMSLVTTACQTQAVDRPSAAEPGNILFEDSMTGDWRENWFLDGEKATITQDENGLHFQAGTEPDLAPRRNESPELRELYDSYHAVLWTQQEFEGEIGLSFEMTRTSGGFTFLIYMLAQGVGWGPYAEDITEWNVRRVINSGTPASVNLSGIQSTTTFLRKTPTRSTSNCAPKPCASASRKLETPTMLWTGLSAA